MRASCVLLQISFGLCLGPVAVAYAQTVPAFDVATIRPSNSQVVGIFTYPGGRVEALHCTLRTLLLEAFQIQSFQLSGGPAWMDGDAFDVVAKPAADTETAKLNPASPKVSLNGDQRQMLQALLIDRFGLKFHHAAKEAPVYLLMRNDKELKLQAPKDPEDFPWVGGVDGGGIAWPTGMAGRNISMPQMAVRLARYMGRPVVDQTGLTGSYDFHYATGTTDMEADIPDSIITSLNALGLKLSAGKAQVDAIVVERVEKPSGN